MSAGPVFNSQVRRTYFFTVCNADGSDSRVESTSMAEVQAKRILCVDEGEDVSDIQLDVQRILHHI